MTARLEPLSVRETAPFGPAAWTRLRPVNASLDNILSLLLCAEEMVDRSMHHVIVLSGVFARRRPWPTSVTIYLPPPLAAGIVERLVSPPSDRAY